MTGSTPISRIKVFGERNTGTNFAERLIALNYPALTVLRHGNNDGLAEQAARFGPDLTPLVLERLIDGRRAAEFPQNFGWKHAAVSVGRLRSVPSFRTTGFVLLVRNPFRFLASLWRRPYNLIMPGGPPQDLSTFLRTPILANQRDGLEYAWIASPVDLWTAKVRAHIEAAQELRQQALLVRYEDLVAQPTLITEWLGGLGLAEPRTFEIPDASTKGDALRYQDYRAEAAEKDPAEAFSACDRDFIAGRLEDDLCERFAYSL